MGHICRVWNGQDDTSAEIGTSRGTYIEDGVGRGRSYTWRPEWAGASRSGARHDWVYSSWGTSARLRSEGGPGTSAKYNKASAASEMHVPQIARGTSSSPAPGNIGSSRVISQGNRHGRMRDCLTRRGTLSSGGSVLQSCVGAQNTRMLRRKIAGDGRG